MYWASHGLLRSLFRARFVVWWTSAEYKVELPSTGSISLFAGAVPDLNCCLNSLLSFRTFIPLQPVVVDGRATQFRASSPTRRGDLSLATASCCELNLQLITHSPLVVVARRDGAPYYAPRK